MVLKENLNFFKNQKLYKKFSSINIFNKAFSIYL